MVEVGESLDLKLLAHSTKVLLMLRETLDIEWAKVVSHLESHSFSEMCFDILTVTVVQSTLAVATALKMPVAMIPSTTHQ